MPPAPSSRTLFHGVTLCNSSFSTLHLSICQGWNSNYSVQRTHCDYFSSSTGNMKNHINACHWMENSRYPFIQGTHLLRFGFLLTISLLYLLILVRGVGYLHGSRQLYNNQLKPSQKTGTSSNNTEVKYFQCWTRSSNAKPKLVPWI